MCNTYWYIYIYINMHPYIRTYLYIHTFHTFMRTYMHTWIHACPTIHSHISGGLHMFYRILSKWSTHVFAEYSNTFSQAAIPMFWVQEVLAIPSWKKKQRDLWKPWHPLQISNYPLLHTQQNQSWELGEGAFNTRIRRWIRGMASLHHHGTATTAVPAPWRWKLYQLLAVIAQQNETILLPAWLVCVTFEECNVNVFLHASILGVRFNQKLTHFTISSFLASFYSRMLKSCHLDSKMFRNTSESSDLWGS